MVAVKESGPKKDYFSSSTRHCSKVILPHIDLGYLDVKLEKQKHNHIEKQPKRKGTLGVLNHHLSGKLQKQGNKALLSPIRLG